jgi:hypothetical protein
MIGLSFLLVILGCGRSSDWAAPPAPDAIFPHAPGYDAALAHGADFLEGGASACVRCHEVEPDTPFCAECHDTYPHQAGWEDGERHGEKRSGLLAQREPCEKCHGVEGTAAGRMGCTGCHASYPHPQGWSGAGEHGAYGQARGSLAAVCGPCHGESLEGSDTAAACDTCHWSFPHAADWQDQHGQWGRDQRPPPTDQGCAACHGAEGPAGVSCSRCHDSYPHAEGWSVGHVAWSSARGEGTCEGCHGPGEGPAAMPATCAPRCHGGAE